MTFEEFNLSVNSDHLPEGISLLLVTLWFDKKGDWNKAHEVSQNLHNTLENKT